MRLFNGIRDYVREVIRSAAAPDEPATEIPLKDLLQELGLSGTAFEEGLPIEPATANLDGPEWFAKVDEMRALSVPVQALELCITLPILDAQWSLDGGSDELRELFERNLFGETDNESMSEPWPEVLRRACLSALYGTWCFEKVFKEVDGRLVWRRLADRLPRSLVGYAFDAERALESVKQKAPDPSSDDGEEVEVTLPVDKLLLFPYRREGANWNGISILRPVYKHYSIIEQLYRIANIGIEHSLVGTPVIKLPPGATDSDKVVALAIARALRVHSASGVALPHGYELMDGAKMGGDQKVAFLEYIEHHRNEMLRAGLVNFLSLGDSSGGAYALGEWLGNFYLMALNGLADGVMSVFNRHGLRQLAMLNGASGVGDVPVLQHAPIGLALRLQQAAEFIGAMISGKVIVPGDADLENFVREGIGLPAKEEGDVSQQPEQPAASEQAEQAAPPARGQAIAAPRGTQQAVAGEIDAAVAAVGSDMDAAEDAFQREGGQHLQAMLTALLTQLDAAESPEQVAAVAVPGFIVEEYAGWMYRWLQATWDLAAQRMEEEVGFAVAPATDAPRRLALKAAVLAEYHAAQAKLAVVESWERGEPIEAIASRFAEQLDVRQRNDLHAGARQIVDEVNDARRAG